MNCLILCILFLFSLIQLRKCDRSGIYKIHIDRVEECPELRANESDIKWSARYFKFNKTAHAINITAELPFQIDNKIIIRFHVVKWSDGGWRNNYFKMEKSDPCVSLKIYFGKFIKKIYKSVGINPNKCPIDAGTYSVYNLNIPVDLIDVPFFYGTFKLIIDILREKKRIGCVAWFGSLIEKSDYDRYLD